MSYVAKGRTLCRLDLDREQAVAHFQDEVDLFPTGGAPVAHLRVIGTGGAPREQITQDEVLEVGTAGSCLRQMQGQAGIGPIELR